MDLALEKSNPTEDIGIALLGIGTTFGIWSSLNTSPVGMVAFGVDNEAVARAGMNLSLVLVEGVAAGIYLVYGKAGRIAALATGLSGVALWLFYNQLLVKGTAPQVLSPLTPQTAPTAQPVTAPQTSTSTPTTTSQSVSLVSGR